MRDYQFIFTGDHGEDTGNGRWLGHRELTEGGLRIPLVWASSRKLDFPDPKSATPRQVDIAPTILSNLGIEAPSIWQGEKLRERKAGERYFHDYGIASLRRGKVCEAVFGSLIGYETAKFHRCRGGLEGQNIREFFDISKDRYEMKNLWPQLSREDKDELVRILEREKQFEGNEARSIGN